MKRHPFPRQSDGLTAEEICVTLPPGERPAWALACPVRTYCTRPCSECQSSEVDPQPT